MEPITLYWRPFGPNPQKVAIILEELGVPYKGKFVELEDLKKPVFEDVNPNGRVPAIYDPNTELTLWESGAIVMYLVDRYDKDGKISYHSEPEKYLLHQWEHFQSTGQGPYFGQAAWFELFHHEKLPSACERYAKEVNRVVKVLDRHLEGREWLVGDKCTYADLSFFPWNNGIPMFLKNRPNDWNIDNYPNFKRWFETQRARKSVQKALAMSDVSDVKSGAPLSKGEAASDHVLEYATSAAKKLDQ